MEPVDIVLGGLPNLTFYAKKGNELKAKVSLRGKPAPDVLWKRDGAVLRQTSRVSVENDEDYSLLIFKGRFIWVLVERSNYGGCSTNDLATILVRRVEAAHSIMLTNCVFGNWHLRV